MPRQDVPYGGAICRLKERIAEIFDLLGEKLHSINGVEGDGQGNVTIRSGDAAVIINNDQAQHEIEIALDSSQLPAAAVSSVNGQTGAVALTADDIPSDNGDVQTDIDNLEATDTTLQGNINAEALARQNADSTLQTNINSANAAISGKVSKLTTAGDYAYTHSGSTDGEIALVDGTTASTIPVRDANGRMQAADPASGATDKTLVTANWISQTGSGAPNNVIHTTGDESKNGVFKIVGSGIWQPRLQIQTSSIDQAVPASSTVYGQAVTWLDKNGVDIGRIYVQQKTDGTMEMYIAAKNPDNTYRSVKLI